MNSFRERLMTTSKLQNLTSALNDGFNLQSSNNVGIGGRTCFGDSGGPLFYGGFSSNTIVGVTSFGLSSKVCAGVDFAYRTDQAAVIDFILGHAPANERGLIRINGWCPALRSMLPRHGACVTRSKSSLLPRGPQLASRR